VIDGSWLVWFDHDYSDFDDLLGGRVIWRWDDGAIEAVSDVLEGGGVMAGALEGLTSEVAQ
jgi:hypothetical protein